MEIMDFKTCISLMYVQTIKQSQEEKTDGGGEKKCTTKWGDAWGQPHMKIKGYTYTHVQHYYNITVTLDKSLMSSSKLIKSWMSS